MMGSLVKRAAVACYVLGVALLVGPDVGLAAAPGATASFVCAGVAAAPPAPRAGKPVAAASLGRQVHALVVFAGFEGDVAPVEGPPGYAARLFDASRAGSLAHFYDQMSFGQFALRGTVLPRRYGAPLRRGAADDKIKPYGHFTRELLARLDRDIDFGRFDNDGPDGRPNSGDDDGIVDYLFIIMRSVPHGFIAGGATGVAGLGFGDAYPTGDRRPDGRPILVHPGTRHAATMEEGSFSQTVGVMAHEFGHALGLPDLYDLSYDDPESDSAGIGHWGLMGWGAHGWNGGDGPAGFSAWSLEQLGWIGRDNGRLVEVFEPQEVAAGDLFAGGRIYKVHLPARRRVPSTSGSVWIQVEPGYLLLEYRRRAAHYYNRGIPGEGLLVWRVGPSRKGNGSEESKLVDLVCADGLRGAGVIGRDDLDYWAHDAAYRTAHSGNLGDAGDLFDGVRRSRFGLATNPGVQSVGEFGSEALTPLAIEVRRRGETLWIDPPRWAGRITGQVDWSGVVLVDGDVEIAPAGAISLHTDAQIRFAGGDRLAGGLDPELSEIRVHGDFFAAGPVNNAGHGISFGGFRPGDRWYGLVVDPVPGAYLDLPIEHLELSDAVRGVVFPDLDEGPWGVRVGGVRLLDGDAGVEAGNGDGRLAPGESARLVLDIDNQSLTTHRNLRVEVRWNDARLGWTFRDKRGKFEEFIDVVPGRTRVELPAFRLDPEAPPGDPVTVTATLLKGRNKQWTRELDLGAPQAQPALEAEWLATDRLAHEGIVAVSLEETLGLRLAGSAVVAADLVVYDRRAKRVVAEKPLQRTDGAFYATDFRAPARGVYDLLARVRSADGRVGFIETRLQAAAFFEQWHSVLLLTNDGLGKKDWDGAVGLLEEALARRGLRANRFYFRDDQWKFVNRALFDRYRGEGGAVVWFGQTFTRSQQRDLADFLERRGRLLVSARQFFRFGSFDPKLKGLVGFDRFISPVSPSELFRPGVAEAWTGDRLFYDQLLDLQPAAQPLFLDAKGQATSVRLDRGDHRLTYYGFDLWRLPGDQQRLLIDDAVEFLFARQDPALVIRSVDGFDALSGLDRIGPEVVIENGGPRPVSRFSLWFEVYGPTGPEALRRVRQDPLAPGARRTVQIPAWQVPAEGKYALRFSLREDARGALLHQIEQPFDAVEVRGGFEAQAIPGGGMGNGAAFFDFDGDADLDLYIVQLAGPNRLYRNDGGGFVEVAGAVGLDDDNRGRGLALGDYDSDGDLDLYLVNERLGAQSGVNRFFNNRGDGRFDDLTWMLDAHPHDAALADAHSGRGAGFFDFDLDGDLDLYALNARGRVSANRLYRNDGGRFAEVAARMGLADGGDARGLAFGDYDRDGDPDLYLANLNGRGAGPLWRNDATAGGRFEPAGPASGVIADAFEVGAVFGDHDADGDLDLFVTNQASSNALWRNDGAPGHRYVRIDDGRLGASAVGAAFVDYDNDGDLDLATTGLDADAGGEELYHNRGDDLVPSGALLGMRRTSAGRGLSWGDYDGDGMQDLLVADAQHTVLYRNRVDAAPWLRLELMGQEGNLNALGARVELSAGGRTQMRELQSSYGYGSQRQPWLHFGLGAAAQVDSLRVFWPGGQQSLATRIDANSQLVLSHPVAAPKAAGPVRFSLGRSYPNPFNAEAVIPFQLAEADRVRLEVFNVAGQRVRALVDAERAAGFYQVVWDGRDTAGRDAGSGVYFYRLQIGGAMASYRMVLVR